MSFFAEMMMIETIHTSAACKYPKKKIVVLLYLLLVILSVVAFSFQNNKFIKLMFVKYNFDFPQFQPVLILFRLCLASSQPVLLQ
jgi:uncharacterized integral membrane protein